MVEATTFDLRCVTQARALGADPAGSAVAKAAFLLLELPLPWPANISDHPAVVAAADAIAELGARVQGVVPTRINAAQAQTVLYSRDNGPFRAYERREACLDAADRAGGIRSLLDAPVGDDGVRDLLVCTHGARDQCCGAMGTRLAMKVASRGGLRVLRTSHLGGHRFAPTAVLFPEGTAWAWLDDALLDAIIERSGDLSAVIGHYRGTTAMKSPVVQFAERWVFGDVGWDYLDASRTGSVVAVEDDCTTVSIATSIGSWIAVVKKLGTAPQPVCGAGPSDATKFDDILQLVELTQA